MHSRTCLSHEIKEGVVAKRKYKPVGDHVQFTKYDYRPYVEAVDLVNSDEFREAVADALEDLKSSKNESEDPNEEG